MTEKAVLVGISILLTAIMFALFGWVFAELPQYEAVLRDAPIEMGPKTSMLFVLYPYFVAVPVACLVLTLIQWKTSRTSELRLHLCTGLVVVAFFCSFALLGFTYDALTAPIKALGKLIN